MAVAFATAGVLVGAGTAALAASGALDVDVATTTTDTAANTSAGPAPPAVATLPADLTKSIGVLARPRTPQDALPPQAHERITSHAELGENVESARHALTTSSGEQYFVVPANGSACLYDQNGGGACLPNADAESGRLVGVDLCAPHLAAGSVRVYGLVPDGVESVALSVAGGRAYSTAVSNNVYAATFEARSGSLPTVVSWQAGDGAHSERVPLPPDASAGCG